MRCPSCDPEYWVRFGVCPECGIQVNDPLPNLPTLSFEKRFNRVKIVADGLVEEQKLINQKMKR